MGKGERRGRAGRRRVGGRHHHNRRHHGGGGASLAFRAGAGSLTRTQRNQRQVGLLTFMLLIPGITLTAMFCCEPDGPAIAGYCCLGFSGLLFLVSIVLSHKVREEARNNPTTTQAQQVRGVTVQSDGTTMHGLTVLGLQQQQQNPQLQQMMSALFQQLQDPQVQQQQREMMASPQYQQMMANLAQQNPQLQQAMSSPQYQEMMSNLGQQSAGQPYPGSQPYPGPAAAGGFGPAPSAPPPSGPAPPPQYGFTYNTSDNYNTQYSAGTSDLPPPPAYSTVVNEKL
ncbi:mediator of RNA polymerase II transcription subunit 15-like isoform X2 [Branchiostoma floridae]|uniref:Mediator of RNA polymerase II transcription subunit 15-like isoform X2 n=1 Tax=Branchiostoma floridae TaxID=7739 RepID=A0A9J7N6V7_BRAFL|nr:mediator of RNA polymerase II transcription subunit 15-like isoform X2 [Branchiostoma floridae]